MADHDTAQVADVALDPRTSGSDAIYTYYAEPNVRVGDAVLVPLGTRVILGIVTRLRVVTEMQLGFPFAALRAMQGVVSGLSIPISVMDLAETVAAETLCSLPTALTLVAPPGVRERLSTTWRLRAVSAEKLSPTQSEVCRVMSEQGGILSNNDFTRLSPGLQRAMKALLEKGIVEREITLTPVAERQTIQGLLQLAPDGSKIEKFLREEGRRKPAQALALISLQEAPQAQFSLAEVRALSSVTVATVKALLDAGLLERVQPTQSHSQSAPVLNEYQQAAVNALSIPIRDHAFKRFLLYGVTGSGKTEVYMRAAAESLRAGRQVLYVVPEIALAGQVIGQLRRRFGQSVVLLHSELSIGERLKNWMRVRSGEAPIVVGARSALFAPLENIGLIVVDEEHDGAYKQDNAPRYHAKRVALRLGQLHRAPVVLGSATPSVESFLEAQNEVELLQLPYRAAAENLPTVEIEDLTVGYKRGSPSILSARLAELLTDTLERGEQAILFLNRRAYAPSIICRDCGHHLDCPNCSVALSFHRKIVKMKCHHCGYQAVPPDSCPKCDGNRLKPFGVGTEKVEEEIGKLFPEHRVGRLDRDVAQKKGAIEQVLADFRAGDIHVLVGTQMVAKGLDFPNVTLVGVIAADLSLNVPDFRSTERTFQLLSQVAGRAGRGEKPGRVVIQTFNPTHPALQLAQQHDYLRMFEYLRTEREGSAYPPYSRLVNILQTGEVRDDVMNAGSRILKLLQAEARSRQVDLLGPVDCAVDRVQGRWRRHILLKMPPDTAVSWIGDALRSADFGDVRVTIDVDPYSMT